MRKHSDQVHYPPYTPITSLGQELGILFAFSSACILTVVIYAIFWQAAQKRAAIKDEERRRDLHARGFHHERGGYHEKVLGQFQARSLEARTQGQSLRFLTQPTGILNGDEDEYNQAQWEMTHMQQQNGGATAAGSSSSAGRTGSAGSSKNRGGQQQHDGSTLRSQSVSQQSGGGDSSIGAMRTFSHSTEINTNDML